MVFEDETYAIFLAYGTVGFIGRWLNDGMQGTITEVVQKLTNVGKLAMQQVQHSMQDTAGHP